MPKEIEITISRGDLSQANSEFGLQEKRLRSLEGKGVDRRRSRRAVAENKGKVRRESEDRRRRAPEETLVVTTEAGTPIAFLKGEKISFKETSPAPSSSSHGRPGGGKLEGTQGDQTTP